MPIEMSPERRRWYAEEERKALEDRSRNRKKGNEAEDRVVRELRLSGYYVTISHASKGCFDLVAFNATEILLVQVKSSAIASTEERERMTQVPSPPNTRKIVWQDRYREDKEDRIWEVINGKPQPLDFF